MGMPSFDRGEFVNGDAFFVSAAPHAIHENGQVVRMEGECSMNRVKKGVVRQNISYTGDGRMVHSDWHFVSSCDSSSEWKIPDSTSYGEIADAVIAAMKNCHRQ